MAVPYFIRSDGWETDVVAVLLVLGGMAGASSFHGPIFTISSAMALYWNWRNIVIAFLLINILSNGLMLFWRNHTHAWFLDSSQIQFRDVVIPKIRKNLTSIRAVNVIVPWRRSDVTINDVFTAVYAESVVKDVQTKITTKAPAMSKLSKKPHLFIHWGHSPQSYCNGTFIAHGSGDIIELHDVIMDTRRASGNPGGESLQHVLRQKEEKEFYKYSKGFYVLPCKPDFSYPSARNHQKAWYGTLVGDKGYYKKLGNHTLIRGLTIAITRYEYANVYWTLIDLYNVYLIARFYNLRPNQVNVLIVDGHPFSSLDPLWSSAFKSVLRLRDLGTLARFERLVWGPDRGKTPLVVRQNAVPLLREFRSSMLQSNKIAVQHTVDCRRLRIMFIWRRDYVNHPRNPSGVISRKISNERELVFAVKSAFPNFIVSEILLETLTVHEQLNSFAKADIVVGMHGAGFAQCIFLQPSSSVIEFFPRNFGLNWHFEYLARWSSVTYLKWKNTDPANEDLVRKSTKVPPHVVVDKIKTVFTNMCGKG